MSVDRLEIRQVDHHAIGINFTRQLITLARTAWEIGWDGIRPPEQIRDAFNPDNPVVVDREMTRFRNAAKHGKLLVAQATLLSEPMGFIMAQSDVTPKEFTAPALFTRSLKRSLAYVQMRMEPERQRQFHLPEEIPIYWWLRHVVAHPDAPQGTGTRMVQKAVEGVFPDQTVTAYIDEENEQSKRFFAGLGFVWDWETEKEEPRFGEKYPTTNQRRHIAKASDVKETAASNLVAIKRLDSGS